MRTGPYSAESNFAIEAVVRAAQLTEFVKGSPDFQRMTKQDLSPVTVADFAAQALIARMLTEAFPDAVLVAEEDSDEFGTEAGRSILEEVTRFVREFEAGASEANVRSWIDRGGAAPTERFWTLDPIDGTKGYLRGDQYAIALALIEDGDVKVGALGCPKLSYGAKAGASDPGTLAVAVRGAGALRAELHTDPEFMPLSVSTCADMTEARLLRSYESAHTNVSEIDTLATELGLAAEPVRMDSQAKYAALASGGAELMFRLLSPSRPDYKEKIWDQAAGSIIVEEAGGRVTDLSGKTLDFGRGRTLADNTGVCATNGHLHDAALDALRRLS